MQIKAWIVAWSLSLPVLPTAAEEAVLAEIEDLAAGALEVRGFELDRRQEVRVEARGMEARKNGHKSFELAAAWILDAESRDVVWSLKDARPVSRRRDFREFDGEVALGAGAYEAYFATFPSYRSDVDQGWWQSAARSMARMFGWGDGDDYEQALGDLRLVVRGEGRAIGGAEALEVGRSRLRAQALVSLAAGGDEVALSRGFALEQPMELLVYAVGELSDDRGYDYGWILDAKSHQKVWTFTWDGSGPAGGARKNRVVTDKLSLPAGEYAAFFVTDDSHSPARWNQLPPYDPSFWGITLWLEDPLERRFARAFDYRHLPGAEGVIVELTRMRDEHHGTRGFTLKRPADVRIYAVGEGSERGMVDYGWILDARTRRQVWAMDYEHTEPAGGAEKNRLADVVVHLEPGIYLVTFVTDGTHAYGDWNGAPPIDQERWGISVFGGEGFDPESVAEYREDEDPAVIARIEQVKSASHRRRQLTLERKSEVSIYALGEGAGGKMYDYAWLEDSAGRVVWEMTYAMTTGAGGASKNRMFQGNLELAAGEYVLHYQSDDSHAYRDWNAAPPHDPDAWGVRIARVD